MSFEIADEEGEVFSDLQDKNEKPSLVYAESGLLVIELGARLFLRRSPHPNGRNELGPYKSRNKLQIRQFIARG